jgi:DNA-binding transcriptional ArsR family regulator
MVVQTIEAQSAEQRTDLVFHALGDATRRDIVRLTMHGEYSVSELARRYPMSFAAVQKHVAVLHRAQLVTKHRSGREQLVRGRPDTVHDAAALLDEFAALWRDRLDRFGQVLAHDTVLSNDTEGNTP